MRSLLVIGVTLWGVTWAFGKPEICDVKPRYSAYGIERKSLDLCPGDGINFQFRVIGLDRNADGSVDVHYSAKVRLPDGKEVSLFSSTLRMMTPSSTDALWLDANVNAGLDASPGEMLLTVSVKDNLSRESASFERKITVRKHDLAIIRPHLSLDEKHDVPISSNVTTGRTIFVAGKLTGYDRSGNKLKCRVEYQLIDHNGKQLFSKPPRYEIASDDSDTVAKAGVADFSCAFRFEEPGKYTLVVLGTDRLTNKSVEFKIPFTVSD